MLGVGAQGLRRVALGGDPGGQAGIAAGVRGDGGVQVRATRRYPRQLCRGSGRDAQCVGVEVLMRRWDLGHKSQGIADRAVSGTSRQFHF